MPSIKKKIIILDDEASFRNSLAKDFHDIGYETYALEYKTDGYEWIVTNHPDLIISDIISPRMDGFELLGYLKMNPQTKDIPFFFISCCKNAENVQRAQKMGADYFFSKPWDFVEVADAVRQVLGEKPLEGRPAPPVKKKIIILDDEEALRNCLAKELRDIGYDTHDLLFKTDGYEWIVANHPDLIISDIRSPRIDGFELLALLKSNTQTKDIPFIFLTGSASQDNVIKAKNMGADDFLSKPYNFQELVEAMQRVLREKPKERLSTSLSKKKIIILDDEQALREVLASDLNDLGYLAHPMASKLEGYYWILANRPDIILSDINSPGMHGFEFLRLVKSNPLTADIPFIFVTAFSDLQNAIKAKEMGAADFVSKPYVLPDLHETIQRILLGKT